MQTDERTTDAYDCSVVLICIIILLFRRRIKYDERLTFSLIFFGDDIVSMCHHGFHASLPLHCYLPFSPLFAYHDHDIICHCNIVLNGTFWQSNRSQPNRAALT